MKTKFCKVSTLAMAALMLGVLILSGCGGKKEYLEGSSASSVSSTTEPVSYIPDSLFTLDQSLIGTKIPEDAKSAFNDATTGEDMEPSEYQPIALLGTQVVSGINYAFLCKDTQETENGFLYIVTIYKDAEGESTLTGEALLDLDDLQTGTETKEERIFRPRTGSWTINENITDGANVPGNVTGVLNGALQNITDAQYQPAIFLGSYSEDFAEGKTATEYAVLCKKTPTGEEQNSSLVVLFVDKADGEDPGLYQETPVDLADYASEAEE